MTEKLSCEQGNPKQNEHAQVSVAADAATCTAPAAQETPASRASSRSQAASAASRATSCRARRGACPVMSVRVAVAALIVGIIATTLAFLAAFFFVAPVHGAQVNGFEYIGGQLVANKLLMSQKIFYFHMPAAFASFVAMLGVFVFSIRFLMKRQLTSDTAAAVAMEIALIFVILTMITGDLWTRFEWGVWWTWDPRLTTYLVLMLLCIAYFVLRSSLVDSLKRATYSAVIGIIAFIDVPITMMVTRLIPTSLHPVVIREGGMTPDMAAITALALVGMLLIAFALFVVRYQLERNTQRLEALKQEFECD